MRRVLVVAYHYPPEPTSGAQRLGYLAKYLPEFGWQPTVLTRPAWPSVHERNDVIRVGRPYRRSAPASSQESTGSRYPALGFLKARAREVVFFPDRAAAWIPVAVGAGIAAHRRHGFDAVISSAMPGSAHVVGSILARTLRVPWLADYRDLWTGNPYSPEPRWRTALLSRVEHASVRAASRLTTITPALAASLVRLHGRAVRAIANRVDAEEWNDVPFSTPDTFRIVHAGSLYDGLRSPQRLFAAIGQLRRSARISDVRLDFYGPNPGNLTELARQAGVEDVLRYHGVVERADAMRAERGAALLAIVQSDDPQTASEYGSKIFEYQAAGPRILAVGPRDSVLRDYLERNELGWFATTIEEVAAALLEAHRSYREGRALRPNLQAESARSLAGDFAEVLNEMMSSQVLEDCSIRDTGLENKEAATLR